MLVDWKLFRMKPTLFDPLNSCCERFSSRLFSNLLAALLVCVCSFSSVDVSKHLRLCDVSTAAWRKVQFEAISHFQSLWHWNVITSTKEVVFALTAGWAPAPLNRMSAKREWMDGWWVCCWFVCLLDCQLDYWKSYTLIFMKLACAGWTWPKEEPIQFWQRLAW